MAEDIQKIKVSELPEARSLTGLFALGVDNTNKSVKVGLEFLESAAAGHLGWYGGFHGREFGMHPHREA